MASVFKSHILRTQSSLRLLWPHIPHNARFSCRRISQFAIFLLPHHLLRLSHSLPLLHCSHLHPPPLRPLLRSRLRLLFRPMSSLSSSDGAADKTVRVVIKGRVQGVFYRNWTTDNAKELGLKGWVRNRRDGSVEALFSGSPEKVEEMEQRCRRGPPDAMVTGLQLMSRIDIEPDEGGNDFPPPLAVDESQEITHPSGQDEHYQTDKNTRKLTPKFFLGLPASLVLAYQSFGVV